MAVAAQAADFQGVVGSLEAVVRRQPAYVLFYGFVFGQVYDFAAIIAAEVVVMVPEHVTQFYFGLSAQPQAGDYTEFFKQVHVAIHGDLVVLGEQAYKFLHGQGGVLLQNGK